MAYSQLPWLDQASQAGSVTPRSILVPPTSPTLQSPTLKSLMENPRARLSILDPPHTSLHHPADIARSKTPPLRPTSPQRHHRRANSAPKMLKETLNVGFSESKAGERRENQYVLKNEIG